MRHLLTLLLSVSVLLPLGAASPTEVGPGAPERHLAQDDKRSGLEHYNVSKKGLALEGYDPVAYFPDHGAKATKGLETITAVHKGVTYRFATEANKAAFLKAPESFEPQYGGWCAWAMADGKGDKVDIDPQSFLVEGGKLYLFYDGFFGDTRKSWNKAGGATKLAAKAVENWARISAPKK
jgi:YHS domain-containing protein